MKSLFKTALLTLTLASFQGFADEDYQHFPSVASENLQSALCNLANYNTKIAPLIDSEQRSVEDMLKVHELTYTLEEALAQLQKDIAQMAADLEEVHLASERMDQDTIATQGKAYLEASQTLSNEPVCSE